MVIFLLEKDDSVVINSNFKIDNGVWVIIKQKWHHSYKDKENSMFRLLPLENQVVEFSLKNWNDGATIVDASLMENCLISSFSLEC